MAEQKEQAKQARDTSKDQRSISPDHADKNTTAKGGRLDRGASNVLDAARKTSNATASPFNDKNVQ